MMDHMGTWGAGAFENDTAMDAADLWETAVGEGMTPDQAEAHVREKLAGLFDLDGEAIEAALAALKAGERPEFGQAEPPESWPEPSPEWRERHRLMIRDLNRRMGYLKDEE
jgi:hypothetical protein